MTRPSPAAKPACASPSHSPPEHSVWKAGLFGIVVVRDGLGTHVTAVAVPGRAGHVAGRGRVGVHGLRVADDVPVVVVAENPGAQLVGAEFGTEVVLDQVVCLFGAEPHSRIPAGLEERLVLRRDIADRHPGRGVPLEELREVVGQRLVGVRPERPADHRVGRLHPTRRAPRRRHHGQLRVEPTGLLEQRDDVGPVMVDGEVGEGRVGLTGRHVVVRVVPVHREVGGAHRLAQEAQADALPAEQVPHHRVALLAAESGADQPGGGVGERRAEAGDLLILPPGVDGDRRPARRLPGLPGHRRLAGEVGLGAEIGEEHRHPGRLACRGGPRGRTQCEHRGCRGQRDS